MSEESSEQPIEPSRPGEYLNSPKKVVTFKEFAQAIQSEDLRRAGEILSQLMGISTVDGLAAATFFREKLGDNPGLFRHVMQIRTEIQNGKNNAAMKLVMDCFNLDGLNAMQALEKLRGMA